LCSDAATAIVLLLEQLPFCLSNLNDDRRNLLKSRPVITYSMV